jgi:hypothetical protein
MTTEITTTMSFKKGDNIIKTEMVYPNGALVVDGYDAQQRLMAHSLGGGFQLSIPAHKVRRFRVVTEGERGAALFRKGRFALADNGRAFDGWSIGQLWNGWEMPSFERQVGMEILGWMGDDKARYDADNDAFVTVNQDGEDDVWPAESITITDGTRIRAYGLGAGSWIWEEL